jgi:radical SAM superfamily enzyme YgiQ (UPF0313 family)
MSTAANYGMPPSELMKVKRYGRGLCARQIYLVAPRNPKSFWSMQGTAEIFSAAALMPNAALATLMALTPADVTVEYVHCDENVEPVNLDLDCDLVVVTGMTLHALRIRQLCTAFRARGVPVALGGTYASICPEQCEGLADHLFVGEAEETWPRFLRQWCAGRAEARYEQREYIDLTRSPRPDWSLIEPDNYLNMCVQTSRGCPHRCDFCDVVQYLGRRYRTKGIDQILDEVRHAHAAGGRTVFFSDDNFLGNKAFTKELLPALIDWNSRQERPLAFATQITMQVADDEELLALLADARFTVLFLGLETVRRQSLEEVHKSHNLSHDPIERVRRISRFGIVPFLGLMVGFDHDDVGIFDELEQFVEDACAPIIGVSMLNAPDHTPLYDRLEAEGRLVPRDYGGEWQLHTNIIPKQMTVEELVAGYWRLLRRIYEPARFERRLVDWLEQVEYRPRPYPRARFELNALRHIYTVLRYSVEAAPDPVGKMFLRRIYRGFREQPRHMARIFTLLGQFRHFHDFAAQGATS